MLSWSLCTCLSLLGCSFVTNNHQDEPQDPPPDDTRLVDGTSDFLLYTAKDAFSYGQSVLCLLGCIGVFFLSSLEKSNRMQEQNTYLENALVSGLCSVPAALVSGLEDSSC